MASKAHTGKATRKRVEKISEGATPQHNKNLGALLQRQLGGPVLAKFVRASLRPPHSETRQLAEELRKLREEISTRRAAELEPLPTPITAERACEEWLRSQNDPKSRAPQTELLAQATTVGFDWKGVHHTVGRNAFNRAWKAAKMMPKRGPRS
ncbi:MAG: hypothetical protein ABIK89_24995 [Planctomycetota bacterium]